MKKNAHTPSTVSFGTNTLLSLALLLLAWLIRCSAYFSPLNEKTR